MNESGEGTAVDDEPRDEGAELLRREKVHFEHAGRVRADRLVPHAVDAELGDWRGRESAE